MKPVPTLAFLVAVLGGCCPMCGGSSAPPPTPFETDTPRDTLRARLTARRAESASLACWRVGAFPASSTAGPRPDGREKRGGTELAFFVVAAGSSALAVTAPPNMAAANSASPAALIVTIASFPVTCSTFLLRYRRRTGQHNRRCAQRRRGGSGISSTVRT